MGQDRKVRRRRDQDGFPGAAFDILQRPSPSFPSFAPQPVKLGQTISWTLTYAITSSLHHSIAPIPSHRYLAKSPNFTIHVRQQHLTLRVFSHLVENKRKCLSLNNLHLKSSVIQAGAIKPNQAKSRCFFPGTMAKWQNFHPTRSYPVIPGQTGQTGQTSQTIKGVTLSTP